MLTQKKFPSVASVPLFEFNEHRPLWDFTLPRKEGGYLAIEVKTSQVNAEYFMVKQSLWNAELEYKKEHPAYVVALREMLPHSIKTKNQQEVRAIRVFEFMGYIEGSKIQKLDVHYQDRLCPYKPCYCCKYEDLPHQNAKEFWDMLTKECIRIETK